MTELETVMLAALEAFVNYERTPDFLKWAKVVRKAQAAIDMAKAKS